MKKVEQLAKIFAEIHAYDFSPFYEGKDFKSNFWVELPKKSANHKEQLDKDFFIKMAHQVYDVLKSEENKQESLAKILCEIHGSKYVPFYITKKKFDKYKNDTEDSFDEYTWEKLAYDLKDKEEVDKKFFLEMAEFIINQVGL
jgi:hypothetical protein